MTEEEATEFNRFDVPRTVVYKENSARDLDMVLQYLYSLQNFEVMKTRGLTRENVMSVYGLAYSMQMDKLQEEITTYILQELVTKINCAQFYVEGIRYSNQRLITECEEMVLQFNFLNEGSESLPPFLFELPFE